MERWVEKRDVRPESTNFKLNIGVKENTKENWGTGKAWREEWAMTQSWATVSLLWICALMTWALVVNKPDIQ